jgi:hypothetical protein
MRVSEYEVVVIRDEEAPLSYGDGRPQPREQPPSIEPRPIPRSEERVL